MNEYITAVQALIENSFVMRYLLLKLLLLFFFFGIFSEHFTQNSLNDFNLYGKVKTLRSVPYKAVKDSGKLIKGEIAERHDASISDLILAFYDEENFKSEFSESGKLTKQTFYTKRGKIRNEQIFIYNSADKLTKIKKSFENKEPYTIHEYIYDQNGNLIEETGKVNDGLYEKKIIYIRHENGNKRLVKEFKYHSDKPRDTIVQTYNKNNIQTDRYTINKNGERDTNSVHTYDQNGHLIEYYSAYPLIDKEIKFEYLYDKAGNCIKIILYYNKQEPYIKNIFKYDKYGNIIEEKKYKSLNILQYKKKYKYDNKGNKLKEIFCDSLGHARKKDIMAYDRYGNLVKKIIYNSYKNIDNTYKYKYEYDAELNPVKKIVYINGRPKYIIELLIEYY